MSFGKKQSNQGVQPLYVQFMLGGMSSGSAAMCTHPIDLIKVNQQISLNRSESVFSTSVNILKNQGVKGLYKGLSASMARQLTYSSARIGSYPLIKQAIQGKEEYLSLPKKIGSAMLAGSIGALVGNPADLINVRMQGDSKLPVEQRRNYKHVLNGAHRIVKEEGVSTLWRGSKPNIVRSMFMTAGQLASYDQVKQLLLMTSFFKDDITTHFTAGGIAGFIATVVTSPVDVVKTKLMYMKQGNSSGTYNGVFDCFLKVYQTDGVLGFYRGFIPNVSRLLPQTILTFIFFEQFSNVYYYLVNSSTNATEKQPVAAEGDKLVNSDSTNGEQTQSIVKQ